MSGASWAAPFSTCMDKSLTFRGRAFRTMELELMRQTAPESSALGVTEIARTVGELLEWKRPRGGLKNHECRQLLERPKAKDSCAFPAETGGPRRADPVANRHLSDAPPANASKWVSP